jgi:hypothetical protein
MFYSTQLSDLLVYETPINLNIIDNVKNFKNLTTNILVYNFHTILFQQRIFIFVLNNKNFNITKKIKNFLFLNSITELFQNAN